MATLVFSAFGSLLGATVGKLIGGTVDALLFGSRRTREGPRLTDLAVTTSSYGMPIARQFGKMRVPGQIIWSTDLVEHRDRNGGGKGRPSTVTYSYTASFAVALSSRPIQRVGRIWADGKLLRGAAEDLKVGGTLRVYTGRGNQLPDPLMAAAEGADRTPAHTGLAYAVFEDLQLSDYGNRIPALTFEVFADSGPLDLAMLLDGTLENFDAAVPLPGLAGIACEGALVELLDGLDPLYPVDCDATASGLTIRPDRNQSQPIRLAEAATSDSRDGFGRKAGYVRKRAAEPELPLAVLRYYDLDRDYQPGTQRAPGRPIPGQPRTIELPAALAAIDARRLIAEAAQRSQWSRQTLSWRVTEVDPAVVPGAIVSVPGHPGDWRVSEWEWREHGVELTLIRQPQGLGLNSAAADPGRVLSAPDQLVAATVLTAFELPWDGSAARQPPQLFAALSSSGPGWGGAGLYVDQGDGALLPLGPSGRARSIIGTAQNALPPANPLLFDRHGTITITLAGIDLGLGDATLRQTAMGANRALIGNEIIQFTTAQTLGGGQWRLSGLWRGRGGTEAAIAGHAAGERFVLLDGSAIPLDAEMVGSVPGTLIAAIGLADAAPVTSPIALRGLGLRPLSPVHGHGRATPTGGVTIGWTRRARGAWAWEDAVDAPLGEASEAYLVTYGSAAGAVASWLTDQPALSLDPAQWASLAASVPGGWFAVSQRGDRGVSEPLFISVS